MKHTSIFLLLFVLFNLPVSEAAAQGLQKPVTVKWLGIEEMQGAGNKTISVLAGEGLFNDPEAGFTPVFSERFVLPQNSSGFNVLITHDLWEPLNAGELESLTFPLQPDSILRPVVSTGKAGNKTMADITFKTIVKNPDGRLMRLTSFIIDIVYLPAISETRELRSAGYATHSVLASGDWYKIQLNKTGIYKLTFAEIQAMGVNMATVKPENIRLFGNGGGMLPEANSAFRYDDLHENPIQVVTAKPGVFAAGDYILFYATGPDGVLFNKTAQRFEHAKHLYSDHSYYFLNFDGGAGLRIETREQPAKTPNVTSNSFLDFTFYEKDMYNLIKSGKQWLGERLESTHPTADLPLLTFANIKASSTAYLKYRLVARAANSTTFTVKVNDKTVSTPSFEAYTERSYGAGKTESKSFVPESSSIKIGVQYNGSGSSLGWLDWLEINVVRDLKFTGGQMAFADPSTIGAGNVATFTVSGANTNVQLWDVTDPGNVAKTAATLSGETLSFAAATDSLRQFMLWDNTALLTATFTEKVINQDLHASADAQMLIVTHKDFLPYAHKLAAFHQKHDGFSVVVATTAQIYNEFSSGAPDPSAIRDFARLLYKRPADENRLRYLLLYGDGTYDPKNRIASNTNRVLTFQTTESLDPVTSYASDDFFGEFDINEGENAAGLIDIGIGRLPVNTAEEAQTALDKILLYTAMDANTLGEWRNRICLVADDEDSNIHFQQAEGNLSPLMKKKMPVMNVRKVYLDAYKQVTSASRERYPDVNKAITEAINNGLLLFNYNGHGGETGLADEGILSIRDIDSWTNNYQLPVFMTATCEFSRFDDPSLSSAGEQVFLNPLGGAIALFTTSRLAIAQFNISLSLYFYDTLFNKGSSGYTRFGDAIAYAKNQMTKDYTAYIRNFVLLGDPALSLALPKYNVLTTSINGVKTQFFNDTVAPMSEMAIRGIVADDAGRKLETFNGTVNIKIYGKSRTLFTLGNDAESRVAPFEVQDNMIYQGNASVKNGDFSCSFIMPKDIEYKAGYGKISYYATGADSDASGYFENLVIGGAGIMGNDITGPVIRLAMDDSTFVEGGITGENPTLYAYLSDESGINTISNGIGHDIVATLDGSLGSAFSLNNYYTAATDNFRSGVVKYRFSGLSEGMHTLSLKAWDVYNNSSETEITFEVIKNLQVRIESIKAYPNPFSNSVNFSFELNIYDTPVQTTVEVYDISGKMVRTVGPDRVLVNGNRSALLSWDGLDASGNRLKQGIYLLTVKAATNSSSTVNATRLLKIR